METEAGEKPELNTLPVVLNTGSTRPYIQVKQMLYINYILLVGLWARGICECKLPGGDNP